MMNRIIGEHIVHVLVRNEREIIERLDNALSSDGPHAGLLREMIANHLAYDLYDDELAAILLEIVWSMSAEELEKIAREAIEEYYAEYYVSDEM